MLTIMCRHAGDPGLQPLRPLSEYLDILGSPEGKYFSLGLGGTSHN